MSTDKQKKVGIRDLARAVDRAVNNDPGTLEAIQQVRSLGYEPRLTIRLRRIETEADQEHLSLDENEFSESDKRLLERMFINAE
ncbi:MAG TPA: hypothetical protein PKD26_03290 [Pyrinomonadaceae bacterium]|nr:hypothetical protein [Pyrinomonadaceae bacterium]